jgi:hypothetical protein
VQAEEVRRVARLQMRPEGQLLLLYGSGEDDPSSQATYEIEEEDANETRLRVKATAGVWQNATMSSGAIDSKTIC